jgi:hypothetical protein
LQVYVPLFCLSHPFLALLPFFSFLPHTSHSCLVSCLLHLPSPFIPTHPFFLTFFFRHTNHMPPPYPQSI